MASEHFQVFLSHSNRDKPFVRQVANRLQREGVSFFLDESHLIPGQSWQDALEQALSASDSCAVFVGDEGLGPYHRIEMRVASSRQIEGDGDGGFRVIPVLLPGTTQPAELDLPAFLRQWKFSEECGECPEDVTLDDLFHHVGQMQSRGAVILGGPGAGKTTGPRQIAWRLASGKCTPEQMGLPSNTVPVFIRFRDLRRESLEGDGGLHALLLDGTRYDAGASGVQSPGEALWRRTDGPLLWILDGLDEVVDSEQRAKISRWIQTTLAARTTDWFVVTCRFTGYHGHGVPLGPKFVEVHVRPLSDEQVTQFVPAWLASAYGKLIAIFR